ncbi:hypothetical protein N0V90_009822 [Kalmusia sp. IMI 367209]|nr:hypothetical protein N0V90_009822 [Kalmusia sp. IMI 367209]
MALITDLPNEVLQTIIDLLYDDFLKSISALSQTCKRIHDPARQAFTSHVCLQWKLNKQSQVLRFVAGNVGNDAVKSIRLMPQNSQLNAFKVRMGRAYDQLEGLRICLSSLPNLSTFSISLDENRVDRRCLMPAHALTMILKALPQSVVNLELDTVGVDGIWETKESAVDAHVCHAISDMLPRLETLYLRLSSICRDLFRCLEVQGKSDQPTTKLRRAAIKVQAPLNMESHLGVPTKASDCAVSDRRGKMTLSTKNMFLHLLRLQVAGAFPDLQRFVLVSHLRHTHISVQDVVSKTMVQYPFREPDVRSSTSRFDYAAGCPFSKEQLRCVVRLYEDDVEKDFFGRYEDIERAILYEVMWDEAPYGVRMPPTKIISEGGMEANFSSLISKRIVQKEAEKLGMDESEWRRMSELRSSPAESERHVSVERYDENFDAGEEAQRPRTLLGGSQMALPSW